MSYSSVGTLPRISPLVPVPLKVGEVLVPKPGMWPSYSEVELKAEVKFKGKVYWALAMTPKSGSPSFLDTMSEDNLRGGWVRKSTFFRLGKTYGFKSREDTWKILDLYQLENGIWGDDKKAVALLTYTASGQTDIQTLSADDFSRMVEV